MVDVMTEYIEQYEKVLSGECILRIKQQIEEFAQQIQKENMQQMEEKYGLNLVSDNTNPTKFDDGFGFDPLTPQQLSETEVISDEDLEVITDFLEEELDTVLLSYTADMTDDELTVFCPKLQNVYAKIIDVQRHSLMPIIPGSNGQSARVIEKSNFYSYVDRIRVNDDVGISEYTFQIDETVVSIPYSLINGGRQAWKEHNVDMNSVDISVLLMDNILVDDCNQIVTNTNVTKTDHQILG